jgi:hypothetical protein
MGSEEFVMRPIRCVAAVVVVGFVCVGLGCGAGKPEPPPGLNEVQTAGWQAYVDLKCGDCHGDAREGKRTAPQLVGLAELWTADQLASYLADPDAVLTTNRSLAYRAEKYAIGMPKTISAKSPGYSEKAAEERLHALAEYMLVDIQ